LVWNEIYTIMWQIEENESDSNKTRKFSLGLFDFWLQSTLLIRRLENLARAIVASIYLSTEICVITVPKESLYIILKRQAFKIQTQTKC
jgi:hypothetical protein